MSKRVPFESLRPEEARFIASFRQNDEVGPLTQAEEKLLGQFRRQEQRRAAMAYQARPASAYSDAEKIAAFDRLHALALAAWEQMRSDGRAWRDAEGEGYEAVLELLAAGDKEAFWEAYRALEE